MMAKVREQEIAKHVASHMVAKQDTSESLRIARMIRRNIEDGDSRMAIENTNNLISFLETGDYPRDMPAARELWASVQARLATDPEGGCGMRMVREVGSLSLGDRLEAIASDIDNAVAGGMSWISHGEAAEFSRRIRTASGS